MKAMKKFKRIVKESGILQEYKDKQYFQKPSEKKRLRKKQGIQRWKRERQKIFNERGY
ncbi:MAG: 30S ribosomal protein S21 [Alphaproteobacteria bacterium TMED194]|nr:MAG: 30S ribosomal protein S21 [Alphaproteobacteria bacterium TMED194]